MPILREYSELYNALLHVQDLPGLRFASKVADNIRTLERELSPVNEALRPSPEFEAFAMRVREESGNDPAKVREMEEANPDLVQARRKQLQDAELMLAEEKEIRLRTILENELPAQISARQLMSLKLILK